MRSSLSCGVRVFFRGVALPLHLIIWISLLAAVFAPRTSSASTSTPSGNRQNSQAVGRDSTPQPLTVKDSIEMTHFADPSEHEEGVHPKFSPDGERFFIVTEKGSLDSNLRQYSLLVYRAMDLRAKAVQVAVFRSSSNRDGISQSKWLTNESISFIGENPGEAPQVYVSNCRTLKTRKLTSDPLGVVAYDVTKDLSKTIYTAHSEGEESEVKYKDQRGFAVSSEDLRLLSSGEWRRPDTVFQTYVLDTTNGKAQPVKGGPFGGRYWLLNLAFSPDGKYAVTLRQPFPIPESWGSYEGWLGTEAHNLRVSARSKFQIGYLEQAMLVSTQTGEIEPLVDAPNPGRLNVLWSPDSRSVILAGTRLPLDESPKEELAKRKALSAVAEFDIPSRRFRWIAAIPKGQSWSLERGDNAATLVVRTHEEFKAMGTQVYRLDGDKWVEASERLGSDEKHPNVTIAQALDSWPKLAFIDSSTHEQRVILDPNLQFQHRRFGRVQTIHWTGKLGEPWVGGLVYPTEYKLGVRYPLVIQTHDFDPDVFLLDGPYTTAMAAQELANKGIAVLQIGETPLDEEVSRKPEEGQAYVSAYESAVDYLDKLGIIDRSRIGLVGFSRTSYHVKYALTHSKYQFAAATTAEGIDFGYWQYVAEANFPEYAATIAAMYGGAPWLANWKQWTEHSVSFNLDRIHTPLRIEADNTLSITDEWETFAALRLLNRPVELIFIPHGEHPLVKPWERMTSQQGSVDWFTFWLTGEEDPDPAKAEQYVRWRELRKLQEENERKSFSAKESTN